MITIQEQTIIFFQSCILGVFLGLFYDFFRILRMAIKTHTAVVFIEDVCYFAIVAISSFAFIMVSNDGILRGFLLIGELVGILLYFSTLSILLLKIAHIIIKVIKTVLKFIYKITLKPVLKLGFILIVFIKKNISIVFRLIKQIYLKTKRIENEDTIQNKVISSQNEVIKKKKQKKDFFLLVKKKKICMRNTNST